MFTLIHKRVVNPEETYDISNKELLYVEQFRFYFV